MQLNRFACLSGKEGLAFYVPRTKMGRAAHDNSGRNPESADHREEMEPGAGDVPGSCGDSANGHPAPSFEGSANGSDAAGAIRARRAECERGWALAPRFSRDLEPIPWGAESASQELPRGCRKGLTRAGARLSPWAGGPSACRRHSAASPGSPDYCLCSACSDVLEPSGS